MTSGDECELSRQVAGMLGIVAQEPVSVQVDALRGVSLSLRIVAHLRC